jgi:hypothetical protein
VETNKEMDLSIVKEQINDFVVKKNDRGRMQESIGMVENA